MNIVIPGFVKGSFRNETEFKAAVVNKLNYLHRPDIWIRIESEETEPGMPDLARLSDSKSSILIETKVTNEKGAIKFRPDQPRWYKLHERHVKTFILVWDRRYDHTVLIYPERIVLWAKLSFTLPAKSSMDIDYSIDRVRKW